MCAGALDCDRKVWLRQCVAIGSILATPTQIYKRMVSFVAIGFLPATPTQIPKHMLYFIAIASVPPTHSMGCVLL